MTPQRRYLFGEALDGRNTTTSDRVAPEREARVAAQ